MKMKRPPFTVTALILAVFAFSVLPASGAVAKDDAVSHAGAASKKPRVIMLSLPELSLSE
jgi:hypothetical protein